ncbi:hypothetical protein OGATHE_001299 [Ogataea polymorpha]|uniref:Uncharacterized protein n=1 Tax=Ogataea polymorpha TaxID=460523 RepID=A0A9P8PSU5_9ASCO|nr:hypothetical protein OGATHE_001299 [Ogataea polymorpha]
MILLSALSLSKMARWSSGVSLQEVVDLLLVQLRENAYKHVGNVLLEVEGVGSTLWSSILLINWFCDLVFQHQFKKLSQQLGLQSEARLVIRVRQDIEDIAENREIEIFVKSNSKSVRSQILYILQQLDTESQTGIFDISVVVLEGPQYSVNKGLEGLRWELNQGVETFEINLTKQLVEFNSVFRILREVLVDHIQSDFENIGENKNNLIRNELSDLFDKRGQTVQNLCISGIWNVGLVILQNRRQQVWNQITNDLLWIVSFGDVCLDQNQNLLFDGSPTSHLWRFGGDQTVIRNGVRDQPADGIVKRQHVNID